MRLFHRGEQFTRLDHLPGGYGLPLFGRTLEWIKDPYAHDIKYQAMYGDIHKNYLLFRPLVSLYGPDALEVMLFDKDNLFSTQEGYYTVPEFFPRGLLFRDFENHLQHRRIMQAAFVPKALQSYISTLNRRVDDYLNGYEKTTETLFYKDIKVYLMSAACDVFLGIKADEESEYVTNEFIELIKGPIAVIRVNVPGTQYARSIKARENIKRYLAQQIDEIRKSNGEDMFTIVCHAEDEDGTKFDDSEVIDHMAFLLLAAHDTMSGQLSAMVYFLAKDLEWQETLREECESLGKEQGEDLNFEDLPKLIKLEWAIKETLRLLPPVRNIPRYCVRECEILGYNIPANTVVSTNVEYVHKLESLYPDPQKFDPMRFSPQRAEYKKHRCAYAPFGGGPHRCIGMNYAMMQIKTMMYQMLTRYQFSVDPNYPSPLIYTPLLSAKDGLPIQIKKR